MKKLILILAIAHVAIVSFFSEATMSSGSNGLRPSSGDSSYIFRTNMQRPAEQFNHPGSERYASLDASRAKSVMLQQAGTNHEIQPEYK